MENQKQKKPLIITTEDGQAFNIPPDGSLGLLALGYKGLIAWRQARRKYQKTMQENKQEEQGSTETNI